MPFQNCFLFHQFKNYRILKATSITQLRNQLASIHHLWPYIVMQQLYNHWIYYVHIMYFFPESAIFLVFVGDSKEVLVSLLYCRICF